MFWPRSFGRGFVCRLFICMGAILQDLKLTEAGGSATEIVTVAEVKTYLQTEGSAYDGPIGVFITAARQMIEKLCNVSLMEKTAIAVIHATGYKFTLPYKPVTAISEVKWRKCPSEWVVLTTDDYDTTGNDGITIESSEVGQHQVTYTLGQADDAIYQQAIKAQAGWMFNNRDTDKMMVLAPEVKALLGQSYFIG